MAITITLSIIAITLLRHYNIFFIALILPLLPLLVFIIFWPYYATMLPLRHFLSPLFTITISH